MKFIIDLFFYGYAVCYLPYLILTGKLYPGFGMRFGVFPGLIRERLKQGGSLWIHAVSVGEVGVVESFIKALRKKYPQCPIVVTVTTKTGYEIAQQRLCGQALILPSPLDISWVVSSFIRHLKPALYIAVETEIWPNLLFALEKRKVPTIIINGRISDISWPRYRLARALLNPVLKTVDGAAVQSDLDAQRFRDLGVSQESIKVVGNLKFDDAQDLARVQLRDYGFPDSALVFVAGSTHPGEEEILLRVFKDIQRLTRRWHLIVAPRHVHRALEVAKLIQEAGYIPRLFSKSKGDLTDSQTVLVVDTIGDLRKMYSVADLVFMGKSLTVGGGHNIIEPACYAKPVVVGPLMQNFRDVMRCFKEGNGIITVADEDALRDTCLSLAGNEDLRRQWGQRAKDVVTRHQGAGQRTLHVINTVLGQP